MEALTANLSQVGLTADAPTILFPNPVVNNFFDLPYPIQSGIIKALAIGNSVRVDLIKGQGPFKLDWTEPALQSLPTVSKAFRDLAEPIIAASAHLGVRDLTTIAGLTTGPALPSPYEALPQNVFPTFLMRSVKSLTISFGQVLALDPVPQFDFSAFPALTKIVFSAADPVALLVTAAGSIERMPEGERFGKAFSICKDVFGVNFDHANQGPAAELEFALELSTQLGGPHKLLFMTLVRLQEVLANDMENAGQIVCNLTTLLFPFLKDTAIGVDPNIKINIRYLALRAHIEVMDSVSCYCLQPTLNYNRLPSSNSSPTFQTYT